MRLWIAAAVTAALTGAPVLAADPKKDDITKIGDRNVGKCLNFYSYEKEIALGKQLAEEVARQSKLNRDPIVSEFVSRLGQNLARNSDAKVPFTFQVVQDEVPNAFALPGGFIFVNTGLIKLAGEEDELAGAMAHEIAHVAARHMTCQATKGQIAGVASIPAAILLGGGLGGYAARQGANMATQMGFMRLSRGAESEADYLGTQYLYAAGYDPTGAITIFEKLESLRKKEPNTLERLFATHPMDADRIDKTQKEIEKILPARAEYVVNTSEYRDMRERLIMLDAPRKSGDDRKPQLRISTRPGDDSSSDERPTIKRRELDE